jgi:prophage regulatory protein
MQTTPNQNRVLRMSEICRKTGLCQSTIHDLVNRSIFPKPFQLVPGGRAVGWLEENIDQWILERKAKSEQGAS